MSNLNRVIERAQADAPYRERLQSEPAAVLREAGVAVRPGATIEVIEHHADELHLVLGARCNIPELDRILAQAEQDAGCRHRLRAEPKANPSALRMEADGEVPVGKTVEVIENRADELHLFVGTRSSLPVLDCVLEKAQRDAAFRQQVVRNPRSVVEEAAGAKLPATLTVHVHEPVPDRIGLMLPPVEKNAGGELSHQELDAVAGGGLLRDIGIRVGGAIYDVFRPNDTRHKNLEDGSCATWTDTSGGVRNVEFHAT